ncbi:hypothetical protein KFL_003320050 [Klebsormidium nitens]|uniref:Calcineurin-like phosphoesterase domain-containing protein n=1 Tax=Klebsormidium nitens TaxID=105231 RepID=A0A1Y1IAX6_KLENI|nr:hypothetical protein KFL_003320050 [Klebsormidium nitens]|eukprot:GAQ87112.1 hypothetical protein KFL_003320050 [Klebsormidium nitens]
MAASDLTIAVGDIHGQLPKLLKLWSNLEKSLGPAFNTATVIFLGDYNDRGPQVGGVLDWLIFLDKRYPKQKHVFLAGNHDFSFAAFLGVLPPPPAGFSYKSTWEGLAAREPQRVEKEGWWDGEGVEEVHLQGRRWAGTPKNKTNAKRGMSYMGSIYDSAPTFKSYGVEHGDRKGLIAAVPEMHKEFLRNLLWVYEQPGPSTGEYTKIIAVHAGLEASTTAPIEKQIELLKARDVRVERVEALSGRDNVLQNPKELAEAGVLLISGHHGWLDVRVNRMIIDECGGFEDKPLAAVVLPSRQVIRDTDVVAESQHPTSNVGNAQI